MGVVVVLSGNLSNKKHLQRKRHSTSYGGGGGVKFTLKLGRIKLTGRDIARLSGKDGTITELLFATNSQRCGALSRSSYSTPGSAL